jgi:hypothetical protein
MPPPGQPAYPIPPGYAAIRSAPPSSPGPSNNRALAWMLAVIAVIVILALLVLALRAIINHPVTARSTTGTGGATPPARVTGLPGTPLPLYPFTAQVPLPNCDNDGTTPTESGAWQLFNLTANETDCNFGQSAILHVTTPTPSQDRHTVGVKFLGVKDVAGNLHFPGGFQASVNVIVTQANHACAGLAARPNSLGYPQVGFFLCNNTDCNLQPSGQTVWALVDLSSGTSIRVINNDCRPIPEGQKGGYYMELHDTGNTITIFDDSHQLASESDLPATPVGATPYAGLAVFAPETTAGVDTVGFVNFAFSQV